MRYDDDDLADLPAFDPETLLETPVRPYYGTFPDDVKRVWLCFERTVTVAALDEDDDDTDQSYTLPTMPLRDEEWGRMGFRPGQEKFVLEGLEEEYDMTLRLKGRFRHFRFGKCKHAVDMVGVTKGASPQGSGLIWGSEFVEDCVEWINTNALGAWSLTVFDAQKDYGKMFGLRFSFSSDRDATLFKVWFQG